MKMQQVAKKGKKGKIIQIYQTALIFCFAFSSINICSIFSVIGFTGRFLYSPNYLNLF